MSECHTHLPQILPQAEGHRWLYSFFEEVAWLQRRGYDFNMVDISRWLQSEPTESELNLEVGLEPSPKVYGQQDVAPVRHIHHL